MKKILFISTLVIFLHSCGGFFKPDWSKTAEPDGKKRAQQNVREGKGFNFGFGSGTKETNFTFASSNPLWRASLDIIDFMSLSSVDYAGGLIITDWYSEDNPDESIKIVIKFLSNEIRADGLKVTVYNKICDNVNLTNCSTSVNDNNDIGQELKLAILKKAAELKIYSTQKEVEEYRKKNQGKVVFPEDMGKD